MLAYLRLAVVSEQRQQLLGRDKVLVLAAAAACRAGWPDVAERCRQLVLEHNPAHLIGDFPTVADALRSEDFAPFLKQLERQLGSERAEFLAEQLNRSQKPSVAEPDDEVDSSPGGAAMSLLAQLKRA